MEEGEYEKEKREKKMKRTVKYLAGIAGPSGYGSTSTAELVTPASSSLPLTAIITGGTSGIGAETARVMAKRGVRVIIPARNLAKARQLKEAILKETPHAEILVFELDLSSFASISRFCSLFLSLGLPLHLLINNAGIYSQKLEFSEDKFEITFATNYLGHFLLTEMLLQKMIETAEVTGIEGRIINVSSFIHSWIKRDDFSFPQLLNPNNYNGTRAYAQSKLANIMHVKEMARQLKARNANVTINAVHPGIVKTGITRAHKGLFSDSLYFLAGKFLKSTPQGAATTCYVALSPRTKGVSGKYFADCNEASCSALASDESQSHSLYHNTLSLIHRRFHHILVL